MKYTLSLTRLASRAGIFVCLLLAGFPYRAAACACDNDNDGKPDSIYGGTAYNPDKTISAWFSFDGDSVKVITTVHDISNIVVKYADGSTYKYDNLSGKTKYITSSAKAIVGVWVKAGNNKSGDCPGCGEYIESPDKGGCKNIGGSTGGGNTGGGGSTGGGSSGGGTGAGSCRCDNDNDGKVDSLYGSTSYNADKTIKASFTFHADVIKVTTTEHEISNIVLKYMDGSTYKYDNLNGYTMTLQNTRQLAGIYVKAGNNKSGDCPGCGEYLPNPDSAGCGCVVLPVVLTSFGCAPDKDGGAMLQWTTVSEINCSYYAIERSSDGRTFTQLGVVPGHGNSNRLLKYAFTDASPLAGVSFYRLKQVDYNGKYEFSPIAAFHAGAVSKSSALSLYPNPLSGGVLHIQLTTEMPNTATYAVTDFVGKTWLTGMYSLAAGINSELLNTAGLPSGIYVLRLSIGTETLVERVVIHA